MVVIGGHTVPGTVILDCNTRVSSSLHTHKKDDPGKYYLHLPWYEPSMNP